MKMTTMLSKPLILLSCWLFVSEAFSPSPLSVTGSSATKLFDATGGWGIGASREISPNEYAKGSDRRPTKGYEITERGEFMRKVKQDREEMKKGELDELLGVARMAGIDVKDPTTKLNKLEEEFLDEEEDLDLRVTWEEDKSERNKFDESVTRLDEDTGALGEW
jgi:hypothetical protein